MAFVKKGVLMAFADSVSPYVKKLSSYRVEAIEKGTGGFRIDKFDWAIVMIHAAWSGTSEVSLKTLVDVLAENVVGDIMVCIINSECLDPSSLPDGLKVPSGCGESYWVRNGSVVHELSSCIPNEECQRTIRRLSQGISSQ